MINITSVRLLGGAKNDDSGIVVARCQALEYLGASWSSARQWQREISWIMRLFMACLRLCRHLLFRSNIYIYYIYIHIYIYIYIYIHTGIIYIIYIYIYRYVYYIYIRILYIYIYRYTQNCRPVLFIYSSKDTDLCGTSFCFQSGWARLPHVALHWGLSQTPSLQIKRKIKQLRNHSCSGPFNFQSFIDFAIQRPPLFVLNL